MSIIRRNCRPNNNNNRQHLQFSVKVFVADYDYNEKEPTNKIPKAFL